MCFSGPTRLLIVSGYAAGGNTNSAEVIDLTSKSTSCINLADFPAPRVRAIAGLDNNSYPIVCGGITTGTTATNMCYTYSPNTKLWATSSPLTVARTGAAYTNVNAPSNLGILVAGGMSRVDVYTMLCSVESLDRRTNIWTSATLAPVPECFVYSCMVQFNSTHLFLTGGFNGNGPTSHTYVYNTVTNVWTSGPDLLTVRAEHTCGSINDSSNNPTVIVAGGWVGASSLSTTEIYNRIANKWETGPALPFNMHTGVIMPHPQGGIVYVAGNSYINGIYNLLNSIYYLSSISSTWSLLNKTLHVARSVHTVINVPSSFTQC